MRFKIGVVRIQSTGRDACILLSGEGLFWILDHLCSNLVNQWVEVAEGVKDILQDLGRSQDAIVFASAEEFRPYAIRRNFLDN